MMNGLLWFLIIFSPSYEFGTVVRLDSLAGPALFVCHVLAGRYRGTRNPGTSALLAFASIGIVAAMLGVGLSGSMSLAGSAKWPVLFLVNLMVAYALLGTIRRDRGVDPLIANMRWFSWMLIPASLLGLVQVAEHHGIVPGNRVMAFLAEVYPYQGTLDDNSFRKAGGMQIKSGGAGRLTSVMEGHPIVAGDVFAFCAVLLLPMARGPAGWSTLALVWAALMMTLSRGSILPAVAGCLAYLALMAHAQGNLGRAMWMMGSRMGLGLAAFGLLLMTPLGEPLLWRVQATADTIQGVGTDEMRTEQVWPEAIAAITGGSFIEFLFGLVVPYTGPTDSQYLMSLTSQGIVGVFNLLLLHALLVVTLWQRARMRLRQGLSADWEFALLGCQLTLLMLYIGHPVYQNRRLLTILACSVVLILSPLRQRQSAARVARGQVGGRRTPFPGHPAVPQHRFGTTRPTPVPRSPVREKVA